MPVVEVAVKNRRSIINITLTSNTYIIKVDKFKGFQEKPNKKITTSDQRKEKPQRKTEEILGRDSILL